MNKFKKIYSFLICASPGLLGLPVYADDLMLELPGKTAYNPQINSKFSGTMSDLVGGAQLILNITVAFAVVISVAAGIITAAKFATTEDARVRSECKKNFSSILIVTFCLGGIDLIFYLVLMLLSLFQ